MGKTSLTARAPRKGCQDGTGELRILDPSGFRHKVQETLHFRYLKMFGDTLPETNIAPENSPSQKVGQVSSIPTFQPSIFRFYISFGECNVSVPSQALQPSHFCCSVRNGKGARYCSEAFPILGIDSFPNMEPEYMEYQY